MATANVKKQPPTPTTSSPARSYKPPGAARSSIPSVRSNTPSKERDTIHHSTTDKKPGTPTTTSPATRTGSPFSAKAVARRSTIITSPTSDLTDSQLENAVAMEDLKKKVAETEAKNLAMEEDFAKQIKALQARIDEASAEQSKLEDQLAGRTDAAETLENDLKELQRAKRDQEKLFEAERTAFMTEKDEMSEKEEAQTQIIQRLKQALNSRDKPSSDVPDTVEGTGQKDKIIESLRIELAEAQTRFSEALKLEERKFQDATDQLAELRKSNAKLQDENESFQLLLGQATMNGDIRNGFLGQHIEDSDSSSQTKQESLGSTLAEEIESASQKEEQDDYKKLENEIKSLKDQNKAMTLYINTMIERLLDSNQENILDRTPANEKALPPVPQESLPPVIPQRSKSIFVKRPPIRASMPPPPRSTGVEEDDMISPITRRQTMHITSSTFTPGHRRSQSDTKSPTSPPANYSLVNPMYRMDGDSSPPAKTTFYTGPRFGNGPLSPGARGPASSSNSSESGEATPRDPNDPNHHTLSGQMTGKTLRPLRLVEGPAPPKPSTPRNVSGNRTSWMGGWFSKGGAGGVPNGVEDPAKPLTPAASTSSVE
ncbi:hypothetical protein TWF173_011408 [Orbilia oligospora]|uniref:M protein, serotype 2.1 n=1 Tax=Orbilia oligospora TaxID=2813651 RepID=A0A7C8VV20_ORBOL|nr:hypothetical protein TWF970_010441 [Orbilia oligospora]KAF3309102.1 hypothetical protein TWF173_011408 [Orbilia oligospora]